MNALVNLYYFFFWLNNSFYAFHFLQYQEKVRALIAENNSGGVRGLSDLDARLVGLQTRVSAQEDSLEEKIQEV